MHAIIQPTKRDSRMALISTLGKNLTEVDVVAFLRVLVFRYFCLGSKMTQWLRVQGSFPYKRGSYKDDKVECRNEGRDDSQISRI